MNPQQSELMKVHIFAIYKYWIHNLPLTYLLSDQLNLLIMVSSQSSSQNRYLNHLIDIELSSLTPLNWLLVTIKLDFFHA